MSQSRVARQRIQHRSVLLPQPEFVVYRGAVGLLDLVLMLFRIFPCTSALLQEKGVTYSIRVLMALASLMSLRKCAYLATYYEC